MTEYKLVVVGGEYQTAPLSVCKTCVSRSSLSYLPHYSGWRGQVCPDDPADPESFCGRVRIFVYVNNKLKTI